MAVWQLPAALCSHQGPYAGPDLVLCVVVLPTPHAPTQCSVLLHVLYGVSIFGCEPCTAVRLAARFTKVKCF